jgi:hypothetical protein
LGNWKIIDNNASHPPIVIPGGYVISAYGYFTIEIAGDTLFPFEPDYDGVGNFGLNNGGDAVRLWNNNGILTDIVKYDDSAPWPTEPDGEGPTLSLLNPDIDNSNAENWAASIQTGGTPGAVNFPPLSILTVMEPNGGENIALGSQFTIKWNYENLNSSLEIYLLKNNINPILLDSNVNVENLSWNWNVDNGLEAGNDYKIVLLSSIGDETVSDTSDNFFSIVEPYNNPELIITEIMYNPPESGDDTLEFIEIYNPGQEVVNMYGCHFSNGIEFIFPEYFLQPDGYVVIAKDSSAMHNTFGIISFQWTSGGLKNSGETIVLSGLTGVTIDSVPYDDNTPWPVLPDGNGPSLTMCDIQTDNSLGENWNTSTYVAAVNADSDTIYATPGFQCQVQLAADFFVSSTIVLVGDSLFFTYLSSGNPDLWEWTFEGGSPSSWNGRYPPQ